MYWPIPIYIYLNKNNQSIMSFFKKDIIFFNPVYKIWNYIKLNYTNSIRFAHWTVIYVFETKKQNQKFSMKNANTHLKCAIASAFITFNLNI